MTYHQYAHLRSGLVPGVRSKTLNEVRELTDNWIREYNEERPHDSLEDLTPIEYLSKYQPAENSKWM